jgi:hypothetical protein
MAEELFAEEETVDSKESINTADINVLLVYWSKTQREPCREVAPECRSSEQQYRPI